MEDALVRQVRDSLSEALRVLEELDGILHGFEPGTVLVNNVPLIRVDPVCAPPRPAGDMCGQVPREAVVVGDVRLSTKDMIKWLVDILRVLPKTDTPPAA
jgi:hypothetical protein